MWVGEPRVLVCHCIVRGLRCQVCAMYFKRTEEELWDFSYYKEMMNVLNGCIYV